MRVNLERHMKHVLRGDALKNALRFAAYLKANEMAHTGVHCEVHYKGQCACYLLAEKKTWRIWTQGEYSREQGDVPMDERMKEIARANVSRCVNCGNGCSTGNTKIIFGKEFTNVCNAVMMFRNPDAEALECVKRLIDMRRHEIVRR
ncbi:MAG: hypothetical protein FWE98_04345 [Oscillospiraceae bacterium]|nr:hypothetical protein [Oscillospiraceae bacterium]